MHDVGIFFLLPHADYLKFAHVNLRACAMAWAVVGRFCACPFVCVRDSSQAAGSRCLSTARSLCVD